MCKDNACLSFPLSLIFFPSFFLFCLPHSLSLPLHCFPSLFHFLFLSIHLSCSRTVCLSVCLSLYLYICLLPHPISLNVSLLSISDSPVHLSVCVSVSYRARKSRTTLQNKVRLKELPEQLTLLVNTSVTFKKCIIQ